MQTGETTSQSLSTTTARDERARRRCAAVAHHREGVRELLATARRGCDDASMHGEHGAD